MGPSAHLVGDLLMAPSSSSLSGRAPACQASASVSAACPVTAICVRQSKGQPSSGGWQTDPWWRRVNNLGAGQFPQDCTDERAPVANGRHRDFDLAVALQPVERELDPRDRDRLATRGAARPHDYGIVLDTQYPILAASDCVDGKARE